MEIQLDLSTHCIETELRKHYNKAVSEYFKAGWEEKRPLESVIDMISHALETFDFAKLRARYSALAGGTHHKIIISRKDKNVLITIDDKTINPLDVS